MRLDHLLSMEHREDKSLSYDSVRLEELSEKKVKMLFDFEGPGLQEVRVASESLNMGV